MSIIRTGFLGEPGRKLCVSVFMPEGDRIPSHWILHVPPFAEEMNKCRPMVSMQARQLTDSGHAVLVPDLYGTGDSEGEFCDSSWDIWKNDLKHLIQWVLSQGAERVTLWGVRLGCLLAADVMQDEYERVNGLLMWQPVHSGQQNMSQFLRLRMAASLMKGDSESVSQVRERLGQGESIEVGGYLLSPSMFSQIEAVTLTELNIPNNTSARILEIVNQEGKSLLPVTCKQLEKWKDLGVQCAAETVLGDPFWMSQEIVYVHPLIEATANWLGGEATNTKTSSTVNPTPGFQTQMPLKSSSEQDNMEAVVFSCEGDELVGILNRPKARSKRGVLIVVGGPQYRVGSHRQFVYLARALAANGIPVFRFDYRGMGDSSGELVGFEGINADIRSAIDAFQRVVEGLTEVVIWGLCDAATASVFFAAGDSRVQGLVLVNPWVYSTRGAAKAYLKHYYFERFFSRAFWMKVFGGEYNPASSASSLVSLAKSAMGAGAVQYPSEESSNTVSAAAPNDISGDLIDRFTHSLELFDGKVLLILSGDDLTAAEFKDAVASNRKLQNTMARDNLRQEFLPKADHTFSKREWSREVELLTMKMVLERM